MLVLLYSSFCFVTAYLLIQSVEKLLTRGSSGERRAMVQRAAEATEVEQALRRPIEGDAHAIEQIDDARRGLAHIFDRRLVCEEVAAVDGVVKVLPGGVTLTLQILCRVDAALRADRV